MARYNLRDYTGRTEKLDAQSLNGTSSGYDGLVCMLPQNSGFLQKMRKSSLIAGHVNGHEKYLSFLYAG